MNVRAKWDQSLGQIETLEYDKPNDYAYVRTKMNVPPHMQDRDAVLIRKVMKDFPQAHQNTIVQRSTEHARCTINQRATVRANITMNGLIVEDDP